MGRRCWVGGVVIPSPTWTGEQSPSTDAGQYFCTCGSGPDWPPSLFHFPSGRATVIVTVTITAFCVGTRSLQWAGPAPKPFLTWGSSCKAWSNEEAGCGRLKPTSISDILGDETAKVRALPYWRVGGLEGSFLEVVSFLSSDCLPQPPRQPFCN
jgi:hypothetical protein